MDWEIDIDIAKLPYTGHNCLWPFGYQPTLLDHREKVKVYILGLIIAHQTLTKVDVIKLDVEGAEFPVLSGAEETIQRYRPLIFMELSYTLNKRKNKYPEVLSLLKKLRYKVFDLDNIAMGFKVLPRKKYYPGSNIVAIPNEKLSDIII